MISSVFLVLVFDANPKFKQLLLECYDSVKAMPNKVVHDQAIVQVELNSKFSYTSSERIMENGSGDPIKDLESKD